MRLATKIGPFALTALLPVLAGGLGAGEHHEHVAQRFIPGQLIIKLRAERDIDRDDVSGGPAKRSRAALLQGLSALNRELGVTRMHPAVEFQLAGASKAAAALAESGIDRIFCLHLPESTSLEKIIRRYASHPLVEYAEPNYVMSTQVIPNDTRFAEQWALDNRIDGDIDAPEAWDAGSHGGDVIIAVVDTGVDYKHTEFTGYAELDRIAINRDEVPDNGVDDDLNGLVDDYFGWDFQQNDNNPFDDNSHGTHVAAIAAAGTTTGSALEADAVIGVAPMAKVLPVKFLDACGRGSLADAVAAIAYAVSRGARIINASWGSSSFSQALFDIVAAANKAGVAVVAAAGNSGTEFKKSPIYPAGLELPNVIAVGASWEFDRPAIFSNWGAGVHIFAPGVSILSAVPNNNYRALSGTSMAAPHVSGAYAVILSRSGNSGLAPPEVKRLLMQSADRRPGLRGATDSGRLNLAKAVGLAEPPLPPNLVFYESIKVGTGRNVNFQAKDSFNKGDQVTIEARVAGLNPGQKAVARATIIIGSSERPVPEMIEATTDESGRAYFSYITRFSGRHLVFLEEIKVEGKIWSGALSEAGVSFTVN